ncbi:DsbA family oxidoreductase [Microbacterium sp. AGC85]
MTTTSPKGPSGSGQALVGGVLTVEMWSDIVCPWCYIAKRRLELAVDRARVEVRLIHRAFQLHPTAPHEHTLPIREFWTTAYPGTSRGDSDRSLSPIIAAGAEVGVRLDYEIMQHCNTRTAHRLVAAAETRGVGIPVLESFFTGYFSEGLALNDRDTIVALAERGGLDPDMARRVAIDPELFDSVVAADIDEARALGANGVPFTVIDRRFGISGAQPDSVWNDALRRASRVAKPLAGRLPLARTLDR